MTELRLWERLRKCELNFQKVMLDLSQLIKDVRELENGTKNETQSE